MPQLSVGDSEALLRALEEHPTTDPRTLRAAARLRQRLGQPPASALRVPPHDARRSGTLHVCTSCRAPGTPREPRERRPGFARPTADGAAWIVGVRAARRALDTRPGPIGGRRTRPGQRSPGEPSLDMPAPRSPARPGSTPPSMREVR